MVKEKVSESNDSDQLKSDVKNLVLFNDDFNTFDFVIDTLIDVCDHEPQQAEQCAIITHYKGKCVIKTGDIYELEPVYKELSNRNLTVEIK
jgi:ATP-dependent Clp protease adaptor protein ClpS